MTLTTPVNNAGVEWHLHTHVVDVRMKNDTILGMVTYGKSGFGVYRAGQVIDATGDADLAFRAGAPFDMAPKEELMAVKALMIRRPPSVSSIIDKINPNCR